MCDKGLLQALRGNAIQTEMQTDHNTLSFNDEFEHLFSQALQGLVKCMLTSSCSLNSNRKFAGNGNTGLKFWSLAL